MTCPLPLLLAPAPPAFPVGKERNVSFPTASQELIQYRLQSVLPGFDPVPTDRHESPPADLRCTGGDFTHGEADMLEIRPAGNVGAHALPVAPDPPPARAHCCNSLAPLSPALPPSTTEGVVMNERERELLERLIENPDWARGGLDPEARIGDEEWRAWETRADQERQRRGWE